jgi:hypothetical protein
MINAGTSLEYEKSNQSPFIVKNLLRGANAWFSQKRKQLACILECVWCCRRFYALKINIIIKGYIFLKKKPNSRE